jgi:hypothetical protein
MRAPKISASLPPNLPKMVSSPLRWNVKWTPSTKTQRGTRGQSLTGALLGGVTSWTTGLLICDKYSMHIHDLIPHAELLVKHVGFVFALRFRQVAWSAKSNSWIVIPEPAR